MIDPTKNPVDVGSRNSQAPEIGQPPGVSESSGKLHSGQTAKVGGLFSSLTSIFWNAISILPLGLFKTSEATSVPKGVDLSDEVLKMEIKSDFMETLDSAKHFIYALYHYFFTASFDSFMKSRETKEFNIPVDDKIYRKIKSIEIEITELKKMFNNPRISSFWLVEMVGLKIEELKETLGESDKSFLSPQLNILENDFEVLKKKIGLDQMIENADLQMTAQMRPALNAANCIEFLDEAVGNSGAWAIVPENQLQLIFITQRDAESAIKQMNDELDWNYHLLWKEENGKFTITLNPEVTLIILDHHIKINNESEYIKMLKDIHIKNRSRSLGRF